MRVSDRVMGIRQPSGTTRQRKRASVPEVPPRAGASTPSTR